MSPSRLKAALCCLILCTIYNINQADAQTSQKLGLSKISALADSARNSLPIEKLFLHFDKPYYAAGDTVWFKAYLFDAAYFTPSAKSGLLYVEFANDKNKIVKRIMLPVAAGLSWGDVALDPKLFKKGFYQVRAYTNWMRNFGDEYIYKKEFFIGGQDENKWSVSSAVDLKSEPGKAHVKLQFGQFDKQPLRLKALQLTLKNEARQLYNKNQETDLNGAVELVFSLNGRDVNDSFTLLASDVKSTEDAQEIIIPVGQYQSKNIDLQFMPEGGSLVAGLSSRVGFKAVGGNGLGAGVSGVVYDGRQQQVASFKAIHNGMGSFELLPRPGEKYTASITDQNGQSKTYQLPAAQPYGTAIRVDETGRDSIVVTIAANNAGQTLNTHYFIVGQARGVVCYTAAVNVVAGNFCITMPKSAFPTGVARVTLLDNMLNPLNERAVYVDHEDGMRISISPYKHTFGKRDSVALNVVVTDKNGQPLAGNFSVSVTDNAQIKIDTATKINSYLLLTSDLKGGIEDAAYYFKPDSSASRRRDLDNLLLTQGWVGYSWEKMIKHQDKPAYEAEPDFKISGSVTNLFNKPVKNNHIVMLGKKPNMVRDIVTDTKGRFVFNNITPLDTPAYILQARNKNGKSFNLGIAVDEFKPPVFGVPVFNTALRTSTNDTTLLKYMSSTVTRLQYNDNLYTKGHVLKNVTIKAKKIIKGSNNLNGPGNADVVIDQEELEKQDKKTLLQLLQENIKGFHVGSFIIVGNSERANWDYFRSRVVTDTPAYLLPGKTIKYQVGVRDWYFIGDKPIKFLVDGTNPMFVYGAGPYSGSIVLKNYLTSNFAEDIKGVEVMISSDYSDKYIPAKYRDSISAGDFAFVEITTRSGHGPVIDNTIGRYLYKPMPFAVPDRFYRPAYAANSKTTLPDIRSTIHWEPNLITGADGKAHISFYASDSKAGFSVIIQGADMNGNVGYSTATIKIDK